MNRVAVLAVEVAVAGKVAKRLSYVWFSLTMMKMWWMGDFERPFFTSCPAGAPGSPRPPQAPPSDAGDAFADPGASDI
jgi:hypothetical protein